MNRMFRTASAAGVLSLFLLTACATTQPTTTYDPQAAATPIEFGELPAFTGQKIVVMSNLSLAQVQGVDVGAEMKAFADKHNDGMLPVAELGVAKLIKNAMVKVAQYPYIVADALRKAGAEAQPLDAFGLSPAKGQNTLEDIQTTLREAGQDWLVFLGDEKPVREGAEIIVKDTDHLASIGSRLLTLGLVPIDKADWIVEYARDVAVINLQTGKIVHTGMTETKEVTSDTHMLFRLSDNLTNCQIGAQLKEVPKTVGVVHEGVNL